MSKYPVETVLAVLRRDGSVVVPTADLDDVDAWRQEVRRACRAAGLRVRTGVGDNGIVWVHHVDHVVTDAEFQAAGRALSNFFEGQPPVPFHELVREEQRKLLALVDDAASATSSESRQAEPPNHESPSELPGAVDSLVLDYNSRQHAFKTDEEQCLHEWYVKIECVDEDGDLSHNVGYVTAYTVEYENMTDPFAILDDETADLGHIGGVLFDEDTGELVSDLEDQIDGLGDGVLIIDSVQLDPAWRGRGLGPLLVGMVIEYLGAGRRFVALQAAPTERRNAAGEVVDKISDGERGAAKEKLGALWSQLGFEFFKDDIWILDLALRTFGDRMEAIRHGFGLG